MKIGAFLIVMLLSVLSLPAQNDSLKNVFITLETAWMNAWKNKDEASARKLMADEFTLTSSLSGGELISKEQWIDKAMHNYNCKSFKIDKLEVRPYGETALVSLWFRQEADANGKDWSGNFLLTDLWVKKNNQWQVVSRHSSWMQKTIQNK